MHLRPRFNFLNFWAFHIRTKTGVVRLRQRKRPERDGKRPKTAFRPVLVVRKNSREGPNSAPFRPVHKPGKRMSRMGVLAERAGFELSVSISRTVAARPPWITVTRGLTPRALETCLPAILALKAEYARASAINALPRWSSRVARLRPDPKPELEFRLLATSTHILARHAVPPSSGRGRRAGASPMKSKQKGVADSYQRASASSGPFIPYFLRQPSATLRGYR